MLACQPVPGAHTASSTPSPASSSLTCAHARCCTHTRPSSSSLLRPLESQGPGPALGSVPMKGTRWCAGESEVPGTDRGCTRKTDMGPAGKILRRHLYHPSQQLLGWVVVVHGPQPPRPVGYPVPSSASLGAAGWRAWPLRQAHAQGGRCRMPWLPQKLGCVPRR